MSDDQTTNEVEKNLADIDDSKESDLPLQPFDLYGVLKVSKESFNVDRARAAYHRISIKIHPEYAQDGSEEDLYKLTVAYAVLKDDERRRIYNDHGFEGLEKSESYMDPSIFETDPYDFFEYFFSGDDPADKEYFLLNGADNDMDDSDEEGPSMVTEGINDKGRGVPDRVDDEEAVLEQEENELHQITLSEEEKAALEARRREIEQKPFPTMPITVGSAIPMFPPFPVDKTGEKGE